MNMLNSSLIAAAMLLATVACNKQEASAPATASPAPKAAAKAPTKQVAAAVPAATKPSAPAAAATTALAPAPAPAPADFTAPADVAAAPADAVKTPSGLASKVLKKGTGTTKPMKTSTVQVHYTGWTTDGKMFDSSVKRGRPATFPLNRVIKGWTEGVPLMVEGEKRRFWIPANLAYGDKPARPGAPAGLLVFDVELLKIL